MNGFGELMELFDRKTTSVSNGFRIEIDQKLLEYFELVRVLRNELAIHPSTFDQNPRQPIQQDQITLRLNRIVLRGGQRRFRAPRIDDDDFRRVTIHQDALPHDGMCDAKI